MRQTSPQSVCTVQIPVGHRGARIVCPWLVSYGYMEGSYSFESLLVGSEYSRLQRQQVYIGSMYSTGPHIHTQYSIHILHFHMLSSASVMYYISLFTSVSVPWIHSQYTCMKWLTPLWSYGSNPLEPVTAGFWHVNPPTRTIFQGHTTCTPCL